MRKEKNHCRQVGHGMESKCRKITKKNACVLLLSKLWRVRVQTCRGELPRNRELDKLGSTTLSANCLTSPSLSFSL